MVTEPPSSVANEGNVVAERPVDRSIPNNKKVPKKEHKAKREKLKRDQLNELFLELDLALEPGRQNNGKASILGDATRLLRDLIAQVESLRKQHAALVTESCYVTVEKNELKDENTVLEAEIEKLQNELRERMQSECLWRDRVDADPPTSLPQSTSTALPMQQPPVGPFYVVPFQQPPNAYPEAGNTPAPPKPPSQVRRPHARYPTPSDSWPLELLSRHQRAAHEAQHSGSSSRTSSNCVEGSH